MMFRPTLALGLRLAVATLPCLTLTGWAADEPETTLTQNYTVAPGSKLVVHTDRGSVTVTGTSSDKACFEVVRKVVRGSGDKARKLLENHVVTFSQNGDTVRVDAELKGADRWVGWMGPQLEVEIKVSVPHEFNTEVDTAGGSIKAGDLKGQASLKTSGGSLSLENLTGRITARTAGGSVKARGLEGAAELNTSGGSIQVEGARGDRLKVGTAGGSINLKGVSVPTEARTSGGSISVETSATPLNAGTSGGSITATLTSAPKDAVTLNTSAGSITLGVPGDAAFTLDASTSAGGVHSDLAVEGGRKDKEDRSSLKGPVNGGGPTVKLRTSAGGIRVKKN